MKHRFLLVALLLSFPLGGLANGQSEAVTQNGSKPTLFIAGDSTAAAGKGGYQQGWGVPFKGLFDPTKLAVVNRARGGRSSRTFITEGLWDQLVAEIQPGDIVVIQFGHNDAGAPNEEPPGSKRPLRARGSLPGLGEETLGIDNVVTKRPEVVHTFGWYMRKMIADAKARGAQPIILSPTVRNIWARGRIERNWGHYTEWTEAIAANAQVDYVDVTALTADIFESQGQEAMKKIFPRDDVHFNEDGAAIIARLVAKELRRMHPVF